MSNVPTALLRLFPITAPDLRLTTSPGGMAVDTDALMTETISEIQNLQQDLGNRLIETPGSNLDFGIPNTRGIGIMLYLSATFDQIAGLPARIDAEFEQDPRVITSATAPIAQNSAGAWVVSTQVETVAGVFGLSWLWSQLGVTALPASQGST
jgi:hypothetical protein